MSSESAPLRSADLIMRRARDLAGSTVTDESQQAAEALSGLAAGQVSLADVDDETLERLVADFGVDAIARAVVSAPELPAIGNRAGEEPAPLAIVAPHTPARAASARRRPIAGIPPAWFAAAASIVIATSIGLTLRYEWWRSAPPAGESPGLQTPAPGSEVRNASRPGVLVLVGGDDPAETAQAEAVLLRTVVDRGGRPADAEAVNQVRRDTAAVDAAIGGNFAQLDALARQHGLEYVLAGDVTSGATRSADRQFVGTSTVNLRLYRVSEQRVIDARRFVVGPGGTPAAAAVDEAEARLRAAREALNEAADTVRQWLPDVSSGP